MQQEPGAIPTPDPAGGIGVIVPFDFALDRELWRWVPEPLELHLTRTPFVPSPVTAEMARAISDPEPVRSATRDLLHPGTRVVAYACTSGSFVDGVAGEQALIDVMRDAGARLPLTTAGALVSALGAVGASKVAIVTPYVDDLTELLGAFLAAHGITSTSAVGLGLLGQIWRVSYEEVVAAVRAADHPDAEAVFISCTNLATYDVIGPLERELGKPVLTANQVTMWAALQAMGVRPHGPGQRLIARTAGDGPHLRAVPDPAPLLHTDGPSALHRVRVRLPDESGALARLAEAVASVGGNILAFSVHGADSESVVDELVVGGATDRDLLAGSVRSAVGRAAGAVLVTEADPHDLVDGQTRALDLAAQAVQNGDPGSALAALLHADSVEAVDEEPTAEHHELAVPAPGGGWLVARRSWAPFTVTETARAEAFVRVLTVLTPAP